jgi:sulfite exporter TauE/SafE
MDTFDALTRWMCDIEPLRRVMNMPWERLLTLYIGEKLALAGLLLAVLAGSVAALNRFLTFEFSMPVPRESLKSVKRKSGFGVKFLVLLLIAVLPGGMVGAFVLNSVMGKKNWRHDTLRIVGVSLLPALLLLFLRSSFFPWPSRRDTIYISGLLGLIFALLQIWVLLKLLREWWGEPDECVAWWPPLALQAQIVILLASFYRLMEPAA